MKNEMNIVNHYSKKEQKKIAFTIWEQIPKIVKFICKFQKPFMFGEKNKMAFLTAKVKSPLGRRGLYFFSIYLNSNDLYNIVFIKIKKKIDKVIISQSNDIYCEQLGEEILNLYESEYK